MVMGSWGRKREEAVLKVVVWFFGDRKSVKIEASTIEPVQPVRRSKQFLVSGVMSGLGRGGGRAGGSSGEVSALGWWSFPVKG